MEEINRRIVSLLSRDGRMSFTELARQTGLSVSAAQQRVRRLERRGVIKGYAALVNPDDAGLPLTALTQSAQLHSRGVERLDGDTVETFERT